MAAYQHPPPHVLSVSTDETPWPSPGWHYNFGAPMSHGCVNVPMDVAEWMYRWASEGTAVTIIP